jgi:hypothetical protein
MGRRVVAVNHNHVFISHYGSSLGRVLFSLGLQGDIFKAAGNKQAGDQHLFGGNIYSLGAFFAVNRKKPGYRCNSSARLRRASGISALSLALLKNGIHAIF